jgi:S1/P1 Nuclease
MVEKAQMRAGAVLLAAVCAFAPIHEAAAWGASGHSIVAEIAQRRLHPRALQAVKKLLGGEKSLASIASWPDDITLLRPDTTNWHFVNIPYDATDYVPARDCADTPKGDCVINAIARSRAVLADARAPARQRAEALKFLVHFVGDVHQPLHCADRNDAGGNKVAVTFFGTSMSLHAVWDYGIIDKHTFDWGQYVDEIERDSVAGKDLARLQGGTPVQWALEAHKLAVDVVYVLPEDLKLSDDYYRSARPVVDRQLALAGVRLARLLNEILAPAPRHGKPAGRRR